MSIAQLLKKIAYLESLNDQLTAELSDVDRLMREIGFKEGLKGIKVTAKEVLQKGYFDK